jgi:hypothetical protein
MCSLLLEDSRVFRGNETNVQNYLRVISLSLFLMGNLSQFHCHRNLFYLKKKRSVVNTSVSIVSVELHKKLLDKLHGYSFPSGFGFNQVACPHYTSEIIIYLSFWLLAPSSLSLFCLSIWVASNLSVVADSQFIWYKKVFPEEIKKKRNWKRIFPGLW